MKSETSVQQHVVLSTSRTRRGWQSFRYRHKAATMFVVSVCTLVVFSLIVPSVGASPGKPKPRPSAVAVVSMPPSALRMDRQIPFSPVVIQGVPRGVAVVVDWGDGDRTRYRTRCAPRIAATQPTRCTITANHYYWKEGTFTITASVGNNTLPVHNITIHPRPLPWSPPEGWVQPAGWTVIGGGATFLPCSTVNWEWDRTGETPDRNLMYEETQTALDMISRETGLKFVESKDLGSSRLRFRWNDDMPNPNAAANGIGGWDSHSAYVTFNLAHPVTTNRWSGFGRAGNGWMIIHEVMHGLGLGHVNDATQIMNPTLRASGFGSGDLEGLHTMYLSQPCPTMP